MPPLDLISPFTTAGDQPEAIKALVTGLERGDRYQTLLGSSSASVTTLTTPNVIRGLADSEILDTTAPCAQIASRSSRPVTRGQPAASKHDST